MQMSYESGFESGGANEESAMAVRALGFGTGMQASLRRNLFDPHAIRAAEEKEALRGRDFLPQGDPTEGMSRFD
jgi:hypothetical protein